MKKSKKKKILLICLCIVVLLIIGYGVLCVKIYDENFNKRFETDITIMQFVEDFDGLQRVRYVFPSNKGQNLTGYLYSAGEDDPQGIIIIAHGFGGGGHNTYMNVANIFAQNGYLVFAYDVTGNDESEGDGVGGVPQGVIDLDHAISFVEKSGKFPALPIALFGHSWGGYSVSSVLNRHPEVKAVIEISGCNRSSDMFESGGKDQAGDVIYTMTPFVRLYEWIKYGSYAAETAMDGFAASDAAVMVVHSADDNVLTIDYGLDLYYKTYQNDPRFTFLRYEDRGHNYIFDDQEYIGEYNAEFDHWLEKLDYDYHAEENKERFIAEKAEFNHQNIDWEKMLDPYLFDQFLTFYANNMQ